MTKPLSPRQRYEYRVTWRRAKEEMPIPIEHRIPGCPETYTTGGKVRQKFFQTIVGAECFAAGIESGDDEGKYAEVEWCRIERREVSAWSEFTPPLPRMSPRPVISERMG